MSLEDYINKVQAKEQSQPPVWAKYCYEVETFGIPKVKVDLIKALSKYINCYNHQYQLDYYHGGATLDYKTIIQIQTSNGGRMAALINTADRYYDMLDEESCLKSLTEKEFLDRINHYKLIGSQKFYDISFGYNYQDFQSVNMGIQHIFYTLDGHAYINEELAEKLKKVDIDELGTELAKQAEKLRKENKKGYIFTEDSVNAQLKINYECGRIPHYKFENDRLVYLGKQLTKQK